MGFIRNSTPENEIPDDITRDSELASAIGNALFQHTGSRLLDHGTNKKSFDCNDWNPGAAGGHQSLINIIRLSNLYYDPNSTEPTPSPILNHPSGTIGGTLIQIGLDSIAQFFLGLKNSNTSTWNLFFRRSAQSHIWPMPWMEIPLAGIQNIFSQLQTFSGGLKIGNVGTPITRITSTLQMIDPPAITAEGLYIQDVSISGAQLGDFVQIIPVWERFALALWPFDFAGVVIAPNLVRVYFRNEWTAILDLANIQFRIVVMGF
jgi:hypothetical protein